MSETIRMTVNQIKNEIKALQTQCMKIKTPQDLTAYKVKREIFDQKIRDLIPIPKVGE